MRTIWTSVNGFLPRCARTTRRTAPARAASSIRPLVAPLGGAEVGQHLLQARTMASASVALGVLDAAQGDLRRRLGPPRLSITRVAAAAPFHSSLRRSRSASPPAAPRRRRRAPAGRPAHDR